MTFLSVIVPLGALHELLRFGLELPHFPFPVQIIILNLKRCLLLQLTSPFSLFHVFFLSPCPSFFLLEKVHSFDLVSPNERVTACDMAHVPLEDASVHVVVFCLSLMGTNLADFLREAHRVLVPGGLVKV